jgi:hypothetical protein
MIYSSVQIFFRKCGLGIETNFIYFFRVWGSSFDKRKVLEIAF